MGNECNGEGQAFNKQIVGQQFSSVEKNQAMRNLEIYRGDVPDKQFASLGTISPQMNKLMSQSRNLQLSQNPIQVLPTWRGVVLPCYIIKDLNVYYDGQWRKGFPNGYGKAYFQDQSYYEGPFVRGYPQGSDGIFIFADGSYKRGQFHKGSLEGKGKFVSPSRKFKYEGFWVADKPHGQGIQTYRDGSTYEGEFKEGMKQGNGIYRWPNGKIYKGSFKAGFMDGFGTLSMENGKGYFQGFFNRNLINGDIKIKTQFGQYEGPFVDGQMEGKGKFTWTDGKIYVGQFQSGLMHGEGTLYFPNGQVQKGNWKDGQKMIN